MSRRTRSGWLVVSVIVAVLSASACTGGREGDTAAGGTSPNASPSPGASAPVPTPCPLGPGPGSGPGSGTGTPSDPGPGPRPGPGPGGCDWTSGPVTVTHDVTVPPVPALIGIRSAPHSDQGFDRIVFDIDGELPGYTVRYVDEVRQDGSGELVTVPGRRYLLIVFNPAQAHTDAGAALISPGSRTLDYPMLRGWVLVGDFEGYVSVALGLDDVVGYRIGELPGDPGRIYLDVAA